MMIIKTTKPSRGLSSSSSVSTSISGGAGRNILMMTNRFLFKLVAFTGLFLAQQQHQMTALPLFISSVEATPTPFANKDARSVSLRSAAQQKQDGENIGAGKTAGFFRSLFSFWSSTESKDVGIEHFHPSKDVDGNAVEVQSASSSITTTEFEDIGGTGPRRKLAPAGSTCQNEDTAGMDGNCCCDGKISSFTAVYNSEYPADVTFYGRKGAIMDMSGATMICIHRACGRIPRGPTDKDCCDGVDDNGVWKPQTSIEPGMTATFFVNDRSKQGLTSLGIFFDVDRYENDEMYDEKIEIHTSCSAPILGEHKAGADGVHALDIFRWTDTSSAATELDFCSKATPTSAPSVASSNSLSAAGETTTFAPTSASSFAGETTPSSAPSAPTTNAPTFGYFDPVSSSSGQIDSCDCNRGVIEFKAQYQNEMNPQKVYEIWAYEKTDISNYAVIENHRTHEMATTDPKLLIKHEDYLTFHVDPNNKIQSLSIYIMEKGASGCHEGSCEKMFVDVGGNGMHLSCSSDIFGYHRTVDMNLGVLEVYQWTDNANNGQLTCVNDDASEEFFCGDGIHQPWEECEPYVVPNGQSVCEDCTCTEGNGEHNETHWEGGFCVAASAHPCKNSGFQCFFEDPSRNTPNGNYRDFACGTDANCSEGTFSLACTDGQICHNGKCIDIPGGESAINTTDCSVPPIAKPNEYSRGANEADPIESPLIGDILTNDSDPDGEEGELTITEVIVTYLNGTTKLYNVTSGNSIELDNGYVTLDPNTGAASYKPKEDNFEELSQGETMEDSFQYTIMDPDGRTASSTVTFTTTGQNDPPAAADNSETVDEGEVLVVSDCIRANDSDPDNDDSLHVCQINGQSINQGEELTLALTRTIGTNDAPGGTLVVDATGCYVFSTGADFEDLAVGETNEVCFSYFICDEAGASDEAQVCIEVAGKNDPPVAEDDSERTTEDSPVSYSSILDNDSDVDGDTLTVKSVEGMAFDLAAGTDITFSLPTGALVTVSTSGEYTFDPNGQYDYLAGDAEVIETFQYAVTDGNDGTAEATVTIVIEGVNDPPVAEDDSERTTEDSPVSYSSILDNDSDVDGDTLTVKSVEGMAFDLAAGTDITFSLPTGALVTVSTSGEYTFDPNGQYDYLAGDAEVIETFQYAVTDGNDGTAEATVTIVIEGVNDPPVAEDDSERTTEDSPVSYSSILDNDSDVDGDTLTVKSVEGMAFDLAAGTDITFSLPTGALVTVSTSGEYTFDPNGQYDYLAGDAEVIETFQYAVTDGNDGTAEATVTIVIEGVNDPPVAEDDSERTTEDSPVSYSSILDNDSDVDGDTLTVKSVEGMAFDLAAGTDITFSLPTGALVTVSTSGEYTFDPNGQYDYLAGDAEVIETFQYAVTDGNDGTAEATVTIVIEGVNDPPVAEDDSERTTEDSPVSYSSILDNDSDVDGDTLTVKSVEGMAFDLAAGTDITFSLPTGALVTVSTSGEYTFDPNGQYDYLAGDAEVIETFQYAVTDGNDGTAEATVTIVIEGVNDPPVAEDDSYSGEAGSSNTITGNILDNDDDPDRQGDQSPADVLNITSVMPPGSSDLVVYPDNGSIIEFETDIGNVELDPQTGEMTLLPDPDEVDKLDVGESKCVSFVYNVVDDKDATASATVKVCIHGVNDAPEAVPDIFYGSGDPVVGNALVNDTDVDVEDLDIDSVSYLAPDSNDPLVPEADADGNFFVPMENGNIAVNNETGDLTYTPDPNMFQALAEGETIEDVLQYTNVDENGATSESTITIITVGKNDPPIAENDSFSGLGTSDITGNILDNDDDIDRDTAGGETRQQALNITSVTFSDADGSTFSSVLTDGNFNFPTEIGTVVLDAETGDLTLTPDQNMVDSLADGETKCIDFDYAIVDKHDLTATAMVILCIEGPIRPSASPSSAPSDLPTSLPSRAPTSSPTKGPTASPTKAHSDFPSLSPSSRPSLAPSGTPTSLPTKRPTPSPTKAHSDAPSLSPSSHPSLRPSLSPSLSPSKVPTGAPNTPSSKPSSEPSASPIAPSNKPSSEPSASPIAPSSKPSSQPSSKPSLRPSSSPSKAPTLQPVVPATPNHICKTMYLEDYVQSGNNKGDPTDDHGNLISCSVDADCNPYEPIGSTTPVGAKCNLNTCMCECKADYCLEGAVTCSVENFNVETGRCDVKSTDSKLDIGCQFKCGCKSACNVGGDGTTAEENCKTRDDGSPECPICSTDSDCALDEDCIIDDPTKAESESFCVESGLCTKSKEQMCDYAYAAISGKANKRAKCCPDTSGCIKIGIGVIHTSTCGTTCGTSCLSAESNPSASVHGYSPSTFCIFGDRVENMPECPWVADFYSGTPSDAGDLSCNGGDPSDGNNLICCTNESAANGAGGVSGGEVNCFDGNPIWHDETSIAGNNFYFYGYNGTSSYMCINPYINGKNSTSNQWTNPEELDENQVPGTGAPLCSA